MTRTEIYHMACLTNHDDGFGNIIVSPFDAWDFNFEERYDAVHDELQRCLGPYSLECY